MMRWDDERYVRLYTRDTGTRVRMPWEARALHAELLRKVDRAGILELDPEEPIEALADLVRIPVDVVRMALGALERKEWVCINGSRLSIPNFLEAQETRQNDAQRKRDQRERAAAKEKSTPDVTTGHQLSPAVTDGHSVPICAVPIRAVPSVPTSVARVNQQAWIQDGWRVEFSTLQPNGLSEVTPCIETLAADLKKPAQEVALLAVRAFKAFYDTCDRKPKPNGHGMKEHWDRIERHIVTGEPFTNARAGPKYKNVDSPRPPVTKSGEEKI